METVEMVVWRPRSELMRVRVWVASELVWASLEWAVKRSTSDGRKARCGAACQLSGAE